MNHLLLILSGGGVGFALAFVSLWWILKVFESKSVAPRKSDFHHAHRLPVPRLGGVGLVAAFLVVEALATIYGEETLGSARQQLVFVGGTLGMFLLGLWDDFHPLGARKKLAGQVLIAAGVYVLGIGITQLKLPFLGLEVHLGIWGGALVTVLWLVGLTNLINLIDGADGLAGGICLMLMMLLCCVGYHDRHLALVACTMGGALLAFLRFNFPPARLYMGDGGAYLLGFLIGLMTILSSHKGTVAAALISPLFVLALPIVDTSLAILRRGAQGLPLFRPDRRHIHHRLMAMGVPSRKLVLGFYLFTLVFLIMGFLAFFSEGQLVPILFGVAVLVILVCAGQLSFSREWFAVGRVLGNSFELRQEIQYALSLSRWLELEGSRATSVEALFTDFSFMLHRLGFCQARLVLPDGGKTWQVSCNLPSQRRLQHETYDGHAGNLELTAWVEAEKDEAKTDLDEIEPAADFPRIDSEKLFGILSELAAEAWLKAARTWEKTHRQPLAFQPHTAVSLAPLEAGAAPARPKISPVA